MAHPSNLATIEGRLATFEEPQQLAKRRASSTKKKTPNTATWPHSSPSPQQLARAGFYFKPTPSSLDSVTCFLCDKALDGWDSSDNPALEHLAHVPDCGWAINICIEQRSQDVDRGEEDPQSERMLEARKATFRDAWPHEGKKGWKCQTKKMIDSGWCYNPLPEADDCVVCFYCGVSLDGWEPKDDPWQEHKRRAPDCHFFSLIDESAITKKSTKAKKPRASRASKISRLSTQSAVTVASDGPSLASFGDDAVAEEGDTVLTTVSTVSKAGKGKKKAAKGKATTKNGAKFTQDQEISMADSKQVESMTVGDEADTTTLSAAPSTRNTRAKGVKKLKRATDQNEDESVIEQPVAPAPAAKKKATRTRAKKKEPEQTEEPDQGKEDLEPAVINDQSADEVRPTRGKKRKSDGSEKIDNSTILAKGDGASKAPEKTAKKGKSTKKDPVPSEQGLQELAPEPIAEETEPKPAKKAASKSQKNKTKPTEIRTEERLEQDTVDTGAPTHNGRVPEQPDQASERNAHPENQTLHVENETSEPTIPSPSAQSSDAENQPPSSRPSFNATAPAEQHVRQPLADTTPVASPSRRNVIAGGLTSSLPWKAADLETIFLQSPSWGQGEGKENFGVEEVIQRLSSPEKSMSVEEWIQWNAKGAEERLRNECERLIGIFEGEGVKAIQAVEGIDCT